MWQGYYKKQQKCLIFIVAPQTKALYQIKKEEYSTNNNSNKNYKNNDKKQNKKKG